MASAPRGFAGLESLIPKVEIKPAMASSVPAPVPSSSTSAPTSPAVPEKLDRDTGPLSVKIIGGLIVIGVIWAIIENNSERPELASPGPTPTFNPDTAVPVAPPTSTFNPDTAVPVAPPPVAEVRPDTIYKPILDTNEIAYCLAEELRMNTVKPLINKYSHAEIVGFNAHVDDYNQRCARYEYHQSDMDSAQAYLGSHRDEIMSEARSWPARWRRSRNTSGLQTPREHATGSRPS